MKKYYLGTLLSCICTLMAGCGQSNTFSIKVQEEPSPELTETVPAPNTDMETKDTPDTPSKEQVLEMRATCLENMPDEAVSRLTENIKVANMAMENAYFYDDLFSRLSDKDDLYWNYIDQKGDIIIGYALEDGQSYDQSSGLTYTEYAKKYGQPVTEYNRFDAENFIALIGEMRDSLPTEALKPDFDNLITNMEMAKETHDVQYLENIYHILHDMDYYLLRYAPEDVGKYVTDPSTILKYYGVLDVYHPSQSDSKDAQAVPNGQSDTKNATAVPSSQSDTKDTQTAPSGQDDTENTKAVPNGQNNTKNTETESDGQDSFYSADEYGTLDTLENHYNNPQGQEGYYYSVDCFYLSEEGAPGKYDLVNQTLQQIYSEKEKQYQTFCTEYVDYYETDENIPNELQQINYVSWYFVGLPYVGDDYVSLLFNDLEYNAGAVHPMTYFTPLTIDMETGKIVTPEEILNAPWESLKAEIGNWDESEDEFNKEYGFYLTDHTLTYVYRTNVYVEPITIER